MMEDAMELTKELDMDIPDIISFDEDEDNDETDEGSAENIKSAEADIELQTESSFDATRAYLNELSKSVLLTADEEKVYGKRALAGDDRK
jgi:RNA polymerase nonessential primary-like sigma factor